MKLHYTLEGRDDQPAIVFLHGMAGSARYWETLVKRLPLNKYRIVCLDLLGYGLSPKPDNLDYGYKEHVAAIEETLRHVGLNEFTLVGHSMGALLALRLATTTKLKVNNLVLINMPYYESPQVAREAITQNSWIWRKILYGRSSNFICNLWCTRLRIITKHIAPLYLSYLPKAAAQDSLLHTWKSYAGSLGNIIEHQSVKHDIEALTITVTIVYGSNDPTYLSFKGMKESLENSSSCRLEVIEGAGHHVPITNPDSLIPFIAR